MIAPMRRFIALLSLALILAARAQEEPRLGDNRLDLARKNFQSGDIKAAHAAVDQFEQANKPNLESLDLRGCLYMEQGKFDEAAKAFAAAHEADPSVFIPRLHAGDLLLRQKKFQEARDAYEALLKETNIMIANERLRFAVLITYLGERDDKRAHTAFESISFPTQTPAYYYAQSAWAFAHGKNAEGRKWMKSSAKIFPADLESWFARSLYELGWVKEKPQTFYQSI
jgi:predicted Zn-dependent protease